jgi:hypothetical protein
MKLKIGLLLVVALYCVLGLFGICLRGSEAECQLHGMSPSHSTDSLLREPTSRPTSADLQAIQDAPVQVQVPQPIVGQFGQPIPDPVGQRQFGQFGGKFGGQFGQLIPNPVGQRQFGQFGGKFGGLSGSQFVGQIDVTGTKHIAIEDGPIQVLATSEASAKPATNVGFVNPKVEPGKVKWHLDFDAACKSAADSGKPVLLFQLMGNLDDRFC